MFLYADQSSSLARHSKIKGFLMEKMKGVFHMFLATLYYLIFFQSCIRPERTCPRFYWLTICCCAPKESVHFPDIPKKGEIFCPLEGHLSLVFEDHPWPKVAAVFSLLIFFNRRKVPQLPVENRRMEQQWASGVVSTLRRCQCHRWVESHHHLGQAVTVLTGTCSKFELFFKFCLVLFDTWA